MKKCFKCLVEKPINEFYKHPQMEDGRVGKCKECNIKDVRANYYKNIDKIKESKRKRNKTKEAKDYARKSLIKLRKKYPEKYKARSIVSHAIRDGLLFKKPCVVCNAVKEVEAHHIDYSRPLYIIWLCQRHHKELHYGCLNKNIFKDDF